MKTKRIFYYDALRAMAIVGIVFCHASVCFLSGNLDNPNIYVVAFFDCLRDFSIPIFVMLSGILLLNRRESFKVFFKKRLSRLLIPFLFWVLIYIFYSNSFTLTNMLNIFLGESGTLGVTFWFVWMIILMYISIFIINKAMEFDDRIIYMLALFSLVFFAVVRLGLFNPYSPRLIYFISFITYIIIGYVVANTDLIGDMISENKLCIVSFLVSVLMYVYYICGFVAPRSMASGTFVYLGYFNPFLLVLSVNIFVFFKYLSRTLIMDKIEKSKLGTGISQISKYSFGIYLVHYLIIDILKNNLLIHIHNLNPLMWIVLIVILTLTISLIALKVLNKIPYLSRFSGVN